MDNKTINYFIIGYMGSGKSETGRKAADLLKKNFLDMDEIIENDQAMSIADMFIKYGEHHFRNLESELLHKITVNNTTGSEEGELPRNTIVSCGSGIILDNENLKILEKEFVIFLDCDPGIMFERIKDRPNLPYAYLRMNDNEKKRNIFVKQYEKRYKLYERISDMTINTERKEINQIVNDIMILTDGKIGGNI